MDDLTKYQTNVVERHGSARPRVRTVAVVDDDDDDDDDDADEQPCASVGGG